MGLTEQLAETLDNAVERSMSERTAVAFSGGLDSGVIAVMAKRHGHVVLYTVGTEGSYDVNASKELAEIIGVEWVHIRLTEDELESDLKDMIAMTGTLNPITLSFEIPLFCVMKHSKEDTILSGQGADELFAGYAKYESLDDDDLRDRMNKDMMELLKTTLVHEMKMAEHFGKTMGYPYLNDDVLDIVKGMEIKDIAPREVRKSVLRDVATLLNQPEIAAKPKKAAQYGSGTMDTLRKIAKKKGTTVSGLVTMLSEGR